MGALQSIEQDDTTMLQERAKKEPDKDKINVKGKKKDTKNSSLKRSAASRNRLLVCVDLDNIAFNGSSFDNSCLHKRWSSVLKKINVEKGDKIVAACNKKTRDQLAPTLLASIVKTCDLRVARKATRDAADHLLLTEFVANQQLFSNVLLVTRDKNLARLFVYFLEVANTIPNNTKLQFADFGEVGCEDLPLSPPERFRLAFNSRDDLDKFWETKNRFEQMCC